MCTFPSGSPRRVYCSEKKELSKEEYLRLCRAAKKRPRLLLVLQTICGTGIRVSELSYFTVEAVKSGEITVFCKNKTRTILLPGKLKALLLKYAKRNGIAGGVIFRTRSGRPLNRSNIWTDMKKLCRAAGVDPQKVFPHNLRKLFARTFYSVEKDIAKLADILGHTSIDTTRIYIMTTGAEHRRRIEVFRQNTVFSIAKSHKPCYIAVRNRRKRGTASRFTYKSKGALGIS